MFVSSFAVLSVSMTKFAVFSLGLKFYLELSGVLFKSYHIDNDSSCEDIWRM